jgi:hypothetical protein
MISKLFWALVIAVAVVVLVPPVRERVWPKLQPAFNPLYEWNAKNEVNGLRDVVKRADATGRTVPTDERFGAFVNSEAMVQDASIDPWGTPFYISLSGSTFQVGSAGRDRQPGTADDILSAPEVLVHPPEGRRF